MKDADQQIIALLNQIKALTGGGGGVTPIPLTYLDTDGTLAANSDVKVASQKAVRTYAAANAGTSGVDASVLLATVNLVPTNSDTGTLYTAPAGTKAVVTRAVMRNASSSLAAMGDGAAFNPNPGLEAVAAGALANLSDPASHINVGYTLGYYEPRSSFGITWNDHAIAATVTIDIFGYLVNDATYVPQANIKTP